MISNLSQLKKAFGSKAKFKIVDHHKAERIGQIRQANVIQTNGFYSIIPSEPNSEVTLCNGGKGTWLDYGKASFWEFEDGLCSVFQSKDHDKNNFVMSLKIL